MKPRITIQQYVRLAIMLAGGVLAAAPAGVRADDAKPVRPSARAEGLSDQQVVDAMHRGIDFLLQNRHGDNWESGEQWPGDGQHGGETALVLYALLNAGASLGDDPAYADKLNFRSAEMAPVIEWLSKIEPRETYTAGLMASALTLVPKRTTDKVGEGPPLGLDRAKIYLLSAMGADGGYTYMAPGSMPAMGGFLQIWENYFHVKTTAPGNTPALADARGALDHAVRELRTSFGGADVAVQNVVVELRRRGAAARKAGDSAMLGQLDREMQELQLYYAKDMPKDNPPNLAQQLANAKRALEDAQRRVQTKDTAGMVKPGNGGMVAVSVEDLAANLEACKQRAAAAETAAGQGFAPMGDLSNAQYGTLGSWALCDYGIEYPVRYWQTQDRFWRGLQQPDGGWPYRVVETNATESMSVAGIASLYVAEEFTDTQIRLQPREDKNVEAALARLTKTFNPNSPDLYYLYGVERVGLASGFKFFGTANWYKQGAAAVVSRQAGDGHWTGAFPGGGNPTVGTAYALLFLSRGRNPVVFNKLQYQGPWNARPRDDAYVTRWMSKQFEKPINWQVVNLQVKAEEWLDAPVLLITGSQDPKFTPEQVAKLRDYVQAGGIIFSTADGGSQEFTLAMKRYATAITNKQYEMHELPRTHPLFSRELWAQVVNPPRMLSMNNGVRDLWIHSMADLGALWQGRNVANRDAFNVPANLFFYATGKGSLRSKLAPLTVTPNNEATTHTIALARLDYAGNADPEPGAWPRAAKLAQADFHTDLQLSTVKIKDLDGGKFPIAHMTGTAGFTLPPDDVAALRKYLDGGGLLLADAAGGNVQFTKAFYALEAQLYPGVTPGPVAAGHPILAGNFPDGEAIGEPAYRKYAKLKGSHNMRSVALENLIVKGHTRVLFSEFDITSGLLGTQTWGIVGYAPDTAEALVRNIVLWAASEHDTKAK